MVFHLYISPFDLFSRDCLFFSGPWVTWSSSVSGLRTNCPMASVRVLPLLTTWAAQTLTGSANRAPQTSPALLFGVEDRIMVIRDWVALAQINFLGRTEEGRGMGLVMLAGDWERAPSRDPAMSFRQQRAAGQLSFWLVFLDQRRWQELDWSTGYDNS